MVDKLREFVYLDNISVNSHLSSLGVGKPQEIQDVTEEEASKSGEGNLKFAKAGGSTTKLSSTETVMSATAPYRFEKLLQELSDEEIQIHENPQAKEVARGDVVRLNGDFKPMSLYKIEIAINALFDLIDQETAESVAEMDLTEEKEDNSELIEGDIPGGRDTGEDQDDKKALAALYQVGGIFKDLAEELIGDEVPLRIEYDNGSAVSLLSRSEFEIPHQEAFFETKEYVIFGRVEERISRNTEWDPIRASNIMAKYFDNQDPSENREDWKETAEGIGIPMQSDDLLIEDRALVVHPIALYW